MSWLPGELPDYALITEIYYIVERRCPPSKNWLEIATDVKDTSYTMKDYRPEKDYMFRIRAGNEYGISDPSLSATVFSKQPGLMIDYLLILCVNMYISAVHVSLLSETQSVNLTDGLHVYLHLSISAISAKCREWPTLIFQTVNKANNRSGHGCLCVLLRFCTLQTMLFGNASCSKLLLFEGSSAILV